MSSIFIKSISIILFSLYFQNLAARQLPVVKANSVNVRILDGLNYKTDYWVIIPEINPDIYYLDLPRKNQTVKFITDIDSISFDMKFGETIDFIVLLNGKDSCYTRISANYQNLQKPIRKNEGNDTIPFTLKHNRIYFQGTINGSEPLNMQFDLGAGAVNVNYKSIKKININFDKKGNLINSDGSNETRVSSSNALNIAGMVWSGIEMYETRNMASYEDVIVGNGFFLDQVYKIDFDNNVIILYDSLPTINQDFRWQNMILDNGVRPVFEATFALKGKIYKDWFLFDTGNASNGILGNGFLGSNGLYQNFATFLSFGSSKVAFIPQIIIANQIFTKGVITLEKPNENGSQYKFAGLIGNNILKQFNVIIDNREGFMYLQSRV